MQRAKATKMGFEWHLEAGGNDCEPVLLPLPVDDNDRMVIEVQVLDAEVQALGQTEAGAVEHLTYEAKRALKAAEEGERLTLAEDCRNVPGVPGATELEGRRYVGGQDLTEEALHGRKRLTLRACGDVLDRGEVREKRLDLDRTEVGRCATGVEPEEAADPMGIGVDSAWGAAS